MEITKIECLADLSTTILENSDMLERTKAVAAFLQNFGEEYFVAITQQDPTTKVLHKSHNKKFSIDWFWENKNTPQHCYSKKKYGYCIEAQQIIYIESKKDFSTQEVSVFTIIRNLLRLKNKQRSTGKTTSAKKRVVKRSALNYAYKEIIGQSAALVLQLAKLDKIIPSNVPVLIQGESGTGKELIARAIHMYGPRKDQQFVGENCAALAETLLESELFGHVKGAFTGAVQSRKGLFEHADKGTIFLDEIGDMSLNMQKKLLRTLQNGEIRPVGGKTIKNVDVRVVAATNKDLKHEVELGNFREDLFYRLNVVTIQLPSLRERENDILLLFDFFYKKICCEMGVEEKPVDSEVRDMFLQYKWPGNIRELQNEVRRIVALCDDVVNAEVVSENIKNVK
ncbi:sigma-54 interaction domain-containing protein [Candidatus Uabimicrobium amorphum]|uniref:Fis family transcriptional regulator n=1 Tax=Uabimicrobium amorphum TaxID=2596890 RepID=A0A5S9IHI3_UABAM|nr:sigma 54-interacting transcriptional regulator [Candidatus Uabimicrobium amorphum]BBM81898.1 Fis family transcriptional regulator [Candidatus Uabimicrobium amorphum]